MEVRHVDSQFNFIANIVAAAWIDTGNKLSVSIDAIHKDFITHQFRDVNLCLNGGFDDVDDINIQGATTLCKVDFVNNTLAEELVNVISSWNDLCENAITKKGKIKRFLYKNKNIMANLGKFSAMYSICIIISVFIKILLSSKKLIINSEFLFFLIIMIIPMVPFITSIGKSLGQSIYDKCGYILETHIFIISKGDKKENERIEERGKCSKESFWFIVNTIISILLSVVFFVIE